MIGYRRNGGGLFDRVEEADLAGFDADGLADLRADVFPGLAAGEDPVGVGGGFSGDSNIFVGSVSVRAPVGVSVTVAGGVQMFDEEDDPFGLGDDLPTERFLYGKLAYATAALFGEGVGETRFFVDGFVRGDNFVDESAEGVAVAGDDNADAVSIGGGVVQAIDPLSTLVYVGVRNYGIELPKDAPAVRLGGLEADPDDLLAVFTGASVFF